MFNVASIILLCTHLSYYGADPEDYEGFSARFENKDSWNSCLYRDIREKEPHAMITYASCLEIGEYDIKKGFCLRGTCFTGYSGSVLESGVYCDVPTNYANSHYYSKVHTDYILNGMHAPAIAPCDYFPLIGENMSCNAQWGLDREYMSKISDNSLELYLSDKRTCPFEEAPLREIVTDHYHHFLQLKPKK